MGHKEQRRKDEEAIKSIERDKFLKMLEEKKNFGKCERRKRTRYLHFVYD